MSLIDENQLKGMKVITREMDIGRVRIASNRSFVEVPAKEAHPQ